MVIKIDIYTADCMKTSGFKIWQKMYYQLWNSRGLIWRFIYRDIAVRYRQSFLGYIWAVLPQIATVALFTYLSQHRVFDMGKTQLPYVIHALWSISVWQLFASCLLGSTTSLAGAGSLVTKINFPKETLILASVGQSFFDFLIRLIPIIIVMFWFSFIPSWEIVFIPFILLAIILFALGIGFILSIVNLIIRDAANAISIFLTFGIFLAPILYPPPVHDTFVLINTLNPFSPLLIATQELLSGSNFIYPTALLISSVISIVTFFIGWRIFHITLPRVAERA